MRYLFIQLSSLLVKMNFVRQGVLLLVICQLFVVIALCDESLSHRFRTINELQSEYSNNEEKLWQQIDRVLGDLQNVDEKYVNETSIDVLKIHRNVFFENTFESNSYWRSYLLFPIENFRNYLLNVNDTLEENYKYLFSGDENVIYNPANVEVWTRTSMFRRLKENSDGLFDLTEFHNDTIFQIIQNVRNGTDDKKNTHLLNKKN